jgi:hypothetical protein
LSKYTPLREYLSGRSEAEAPMSFADIESVVGFPLPPAARRYRAWWSNNPTNSVITNAWLGAGFRSAQVDMANQTLRFVRVSPAPQAAARVRASSSGRPVVEALRRSLAGTVRFVDGEEAEV